MGVSRYASYSFPALPCWVRHVARDYVVSVALRLSLRVVVE